ncbi:AAA family ATPase [Candidatus Beckwithbacteria bacterium]|nr:AAA family ATPase [Candidatus Beckwithbacteria bacterium]
MEPTAQTPYNQTQAAFDELFQEVDQLRERVEQADIPDELKDKIREMLVRLKRMARFGGYSEEYEKISHYVEWVLSLPWNYQTEDNLDLERAKDIMDKHHYGMDHVKNRILEYMAVLKLNRDKDKVSRAPILFLVGLVGTGKTTFGPALSEAMGRKYARIPFGGMGSALDLRGQSRLHADNEPGKIIKALRQAQSRNPVILLDEIDRVSEEARNDIMGVLVEILDPGQNHRFIDHYLDYPFDLSDVLFIATANNTRNVATAVLDRMEVIDMPSYTDDEKIVIGKQYILPKIIEEAGLTPDQVHIDEQLWTKIVRPLGFDSGIRTLERTIRRIVHRVARLVVAGKGDTFHLDETNIKGFLPDY